MADGSPDPMQRAGVMLPVAQNYSCSAGAPDLVSATCGAKTRGGAACRNMPMRNGRCRMHGGGSTGPKTAAGRERWRAAVTIHGGRSQEMMKFRRQLRELRADARRLVELT